MDDLVAQLQDILSSKEGQDKLKNVADMLNTSSRNGLDLSSFGNLFSSSSNNTNNIENKQIEPTINTNNENTSSGFDFSNLDINMLMKVQKLMANMNKEDKNTQLIRALRPHIKAERSHKIDQAIKIMQLISMLPLLKDIGLFGGDK